MNTTYENILQYADELIQQNGFGGFSYADLSKKLGIKKASIHHHFPAKADLGIAYCQQKSDALKGLQQHLSMKKTARAQLQGYFSVFDGCAELGGMCGIFSMQTDLNLLSEKLQKEVNKLVQLELQIVSGVLKTGLALGEFRFNGAPEQQAVIICCAIKGALMLNRNQQGLYKQTCDACLGIIS